MSTSFRLWYKGKDIFKILKMKQIFSLQRAQKTLRIFGMSAVALTAAVLIGSTSLAQAAAPRPQNPQSGSVGLEGTISSPPPTRGATISSPVSGRSYTELPVTVSGLCPQGVMVKLFSNNIFVGSVKCDNGSYSLQIDLFSGQNELIARVYDDLDQAGPDSNLVQVTFNDAQ